VMMGYFEQFVYFQKCTYMFTMRGILTSTQNSFSRQLVGTVAATQADDKRGQAIPSFENSSIIITFKRNCLIQSFDTVLNSKKCLQDSQKTSTNLGTGVYFSFFH
jgi:hypothetical protein